MLYKEIIAVCSQIHTKPINAMTGQNVVFVDVKPYGTYSDHWALEGQINAHREELDVFMFLHKYKTSKFQRKWY